MTIYTLILRDKRVLIAVQRACNGGFYEAINTCDCTQKIPLIHYLYLLEIHAKVDNHVGREPCVTLQLRR